MSSNRTSYPVPELPELLAGPLLAASVQSPYTFVYGRSHVVEESPGKAA